MPASNVIETVQNLYAGLTAFTGKPADLWFEDVWPTRSGSFVSLPAIKFTHAGSDAETDFEYSALEVWPFDFEIISETAQQALLIFNRVRFNNAIPEAQSGFWYASTMDVPTGYSFKEVKPTGRWRVYTGNFAPSGTQLHFCTFSMELHLHYTG